MTDKLNILTRYETNPVAHISSIKDFITFKADTGASRHYVRDNDKKVLDNITNNNKAFVTLPNKQIIQSSSQGVLPIQTNTSAKTALILPQLMNNSLLSIGQLCDDDCVAVFNKHAMHLYKNAKLVLSGKRNTSDGLWDINFNPPIRTATEKINDYKSTLSANAIIQKNLPQTHLAQYLHACAFSPAIKTFQKAINNGQFITWPSIEKLNFEKLIQDQTNIHMGHLDQERKNLQSTKLDTEVKNDFFPSPNIPNLKQYSVYSKLLSFSPKELSYGDLTGSFPFTSSRGHKYLYVMYDHDSNAILVHPLKTRQASEIATAWKTLHARITTHGHEIKNFILDNEFSQELKQALKKNTISYQLVPPNVHRRNAAERAIRTFKAHFMAGLATCDPDFPITEWDRLLEQAEMTLNMLRTAKCHPKLSSYAYIIGPHDFKKNPLAPPGTKVVIHKKPGTRNSWGYHGEKGWYIGPAINHYRCFKCYTPTTAREVIADTVKFIPKKIPFPEIRIETYLQKAIEKIIYLLDNNARTNTTKIPNQYELLKAFKQVAHVLNNPSNSTTASSPRVPNHRQQMLTTLKSKGIIPPLYDRQQSPRVAIVNRKFLTPQLPTKRFFLHQQQGNETPSTTLQINHIYDKDGKKLSLDKLITNKNTREVWVQALNNELGRLSNGYKKNGICGTNTMQFIRKEDIPKHKKITYSNFVCDIRPLKKEYYRVRMTVGGDKLDYFEDTASPTATLLDSKLIVNSTISDHKQYGSKFCSVDIKNFFLQTKLEVPEFIRIHTKYISKDFLNEYNMHHLPDKDGYMYCRIDKGMYGLKQAAILAYKQLVKRLNTHGYHPLKSSNGLWKHSTRKILFALCVDDFGIKYNTEQDLNHLLNALKTYYEITVDKEGKNFCGLTLDWNYKEGFVDISMPGYIPTKLKKYQHPTPQKPQYAPHKWLKPVYGKTLQHAPPPDTTDKLDAKGIKHIQSICGSFLYYARAIDPTILPALNEISVQQAAPTLDTTKKVSMLMDYLNTYPNGKLRYYAGTMNLRVDSDAAYLVLPNARSRVAGHFYLEATPKASKAYPNTNNAPILTECYTLRNVVSSAAEAECGGIFHNCVVAIGIRNTLKEMGHPQRKTVVTTDNTTATSFVHSAMRAKRSKSWDMKYNWLRERTAQNQFEVKWQKGSTNQADYFTKHHSPRIHKILRYDYILKGHHIHQNIKQDKRLNPVQTCKGVLKYRITPTRYHPTSRSTYVHKEYKHYRIAK